MQRCYCMNQRCTFAGMRRMTADSLGASAHSSSSSNPISGTCPSTQPGSFRFGSGARVASTREHDNRTIAVVAKISTQIHGPCYTRRSQQHPEDDIGAGETDDDLPADLVLHQSEHCPSLLGEARGSQRVTGSFRVLVSIHRCLLSRLEPSPTLPREEFSLQLDKRTS
jgi:hypothetical protein